MTNKDDIIRAHYSSIGSKGGNSRWAKTTPAERKAYFTELSRRAAIKRSNEAKLRKMETELTVDNTSNLPIDTP